MGRWTQYEGDSSRLPEGMERIGYDSDTRRYTFRDTAGCIYLGPPGSEYGDLTLVSRPTGHVPKPESNTIWAMNSRFRSPSPLPEAHDSPGTPNTANTLTFHDILSPNSITTAQPTKSVRKLSISMSTPTRSSGHSRSQSGSDVGPKRSLWGSIRIGTVPKMRGVVEALRRSKTESEKDRSYHKLSSPSRGSFIGTPLSSRSSRSVQRTR